LAEHGELTAHVAGFIQVYAKQPAGEELASANALLVLWGAVGRRTSVPSSEIQGDDQSGCVSVPSPADVTEGIYQTGNGRKQVQQ
jgi:hypothetical protein